MRRYDESIHVRRGHLPDPATHHSGTELVIDDRLAAMPGDPPTQLLWRDRLWVVRQVQEQWVETGPWWDSPAARAVRGEDSEGGSSQDGEHDSLAGTQSRSRGSTGAPVGLLDHPSRAPAPGAIHDSAIRGVIRDPAHVSTNGRPAAVHEPGELLAELEVWRVEAICGRTGQSGVLELTYRSHTGEWRLRGLVD